MRGVRSRTLTLSAQSWQDTRLRSIQFPFDSLASSTDYRWFCTSRISLRRIWTPLSKDTTLLIYSCYRALRWLVHWRCDLRHGPVNGPLSGARYSHDDPASLVALLAEVRFRSSDFTPSLLSLSWFDGEDSNPQLHRIPRQGTRWCVPCEPFYTTAELIIAQLVNSVKVTTSADSVDICSTDKLPSHIR